MYKSAIASVALMATAVSAAGNAIVTNGCKYDVFLYNVPASNGGFDPINKTLSPRETYSQQFTELTNKMGWSIKLSKTAELDNILQYEYTYLGNDRIWYDLSAVNGNPWDGNWEITSTTIGGCHPRQAAYRYSTDDSYGMQDCACENDITVLLCSGEDQNDGLASSASVSFSASATAAPSSYSSTEAAPSPYSSAESTSDAAPSYTHSFGGWVHNQVAQSSSTPSLTTFATATLTPAPGVIVTEVATAVVTEVVTMTQYAAKRDEHVHQHARRHPHARQ
ncbi:hypothetical protein K431DRAFT_218564 [Polychaeton citri CBS 116435]|uniref:Uncharacterized protein n=1 Tax=Polychaeton citri CBS 116435 TaxID=1314669 RepID=A0A9P4QG40_9PEZI|nr:hypothetical protein K431DRAFT_218564 [Polychaeton citri CBS 116435]